MSTKSSCYYNEDLDFHVYFDHRDNKHYLEIGDKKLVVTEKIGEAFREFSNIKDMKICPHCLKELDWEAFLYTEEKKE